MRKVLWLDDEAVSISYEKDVLIDEKFPNMFDIVTFERIDELLEFLDSEKSVDKNDIFVIDIMLIDEDEFLTPKREKIQIENDLMAGTILYRQYLKFAYPDNPIILYTSREHERSIFQNILDDNRYGESLFLVEKTQKDTIFLEIFEKLLKVVSWDIFF